MAVDPADTGLALRTVIGLDQAHMLATVRDMPADLGPTGDEAAIALRHTIDRPIHTARAGPARSGLVSWRISEAPL
jgi:hypothetical protein